MGKIIKTCVGINQINGYEIIGVEKRWLICNGMPVGCCSNAYEASCHDSQSPSLGKIYDSPIIGHFYLCPDCNEGYEDPTFTPAELDFIRRCRE